MTLAKSDLQQIGNVISERLEKRLGPIEKGLGQMEKDIKYLRKKVNKMDKTLDIVAKDYDQRDVNLTKRVSKIEEHLDLPQN